MSLVDATVSAYGTEQEADPSKPSKIELKIDHRRVWAVLFPKFEQKLGGAFNPTANPTASPLTQTTRLLVLIDPTTNAFLYAETAD
jgi:hypothetical protein